MTRDLNALRTWILIVLTIAALCTTAVPIIYSFSPWRKKLLGRLFMLQAVSFAFATDMSVLFAFWGPRDILIRFWINALMLTMIAISTSALAWLILRMNFPRQRKKVELNDAEFAETNFE